MCEMSNTFAKSQKVRQEELQRLINSRLRHQKDTVVPNMQRMYYKAKDMLQRARQPKHGGYKTILERWHNDDQYCKSLSEIGWIEEQLIQYDELVALEEHSYIAARGERDRDEKRWVLKLNVAGAKGPTNQRPDFVEAKREMKRLHGEHVTKTSEGNRPIHPLQRSRQRRGHQFEGLDECDYQIDAQTGWRTYPPKSR